MGDDECPVYVLRGASKVLPGLGNVELRSANLGMANDELRMTNGEPWNDAVTRVKERPGFQ